jgi:hypothetical protein
MQWCCRCLWHGASLVACVGQDMRVCVRPCS